MIVFTVLDSEEIEELAIKTREIRNEPRARIFLPWFSRLMAR